MKNTSRSLILTSVLVSAVVLSACQSAPTNSNRYNGYSGVASNYRQPTNVQEYGYVTSIQPLSSVGKGSSSGIGTIVGAVAGGLIGNQVGGGRGKTAATIASTLGGALAGNAVEGQTGRKNQTNRHGYRIQIDTDNRERRVFDVENYNNLYVGDRVKIRNGEITRVR